MFCRKCKYTSFDYLEACPACGYVWEKEKKDLNLDWLKASDPAVSVPEDQTGYFPPPAEDNPEEDFETSPAQAADAFNPEEVQSHSPDHQQAPPPREEPSAGVQESPVEPESELQEIEYTLEDLPGAEEEEVAAESAPSPDESLQSRGQEWAQLSEDAEIEIDFQDEEDEPGQSPPSSKQSGSAPQGKEESSQEGDVDWTSLIEEIELETDLDQDEPKSRND